MQGGSVLSGFLIIIPYPRSTTPLGHPCTLACTAAVVRQQTQPRRLTNMVKL
jgi:hypothetical protein